MSDRLYTERLLWGGSRGVALANDVRVELRSAPVLCGLQGIHHLEYTPQVRVAQPRPCDPCRDMTPTEITAAKTLLAHMAAMARGALAQGA